MGSVRFQQLSHSGNTKEGKRPRRFFSTDRRIIPHSLQVLGMFKTLLVSVVFIGLSLMTLPANAQCAGGLFSSPTNPTICVGQSVTVVVRFGASGNCEGTPQPYYYFQWFVDGVAVTPMSQTATTSSSYAYNAAAIGTHAVTYSDTATYPALGGSLNNPPAGVPVGSPGGPSSSNGTTTTVTVQSDNLMLTGAGATPNPATVNQSIAYAASASTNPNCSFTVSYLWDFNDGTTGTGATPSHSYSNPGVYNVAVTAKDSFSSVSQTFHLTVNPVITGTNPDFYIISNPASLSLPAGTSGSVTMNIVPVHGFVGTVSLSLPGAPSGIWLYPSSVAIGPNNGSTTIYVCIPSGSGSVSVQGTSGSLSHQDAVSITAH